MNKKTVLWIAIGVCLLILIGMLIFIIAGAGNNSPSTPVTDPANSATATDSATLATEQGTNSTTAPTKDSGTEPTKATSPEPTKGTEPSSTPTTKPTTDPTTEPTTPAGTEPDPTTKPTVPQPTEPQPTEKDEPDDTVPPTTEPNQEDPTLTFPYRVSGYDLVIEKIAPYDGLFVEDGSNVQRTNVAMLLIHNDNDKALEHAQITIAFADDTLEFRLSALPAGQRMVVQEYTGKEIPADTPLEVSVLAVQQTEMTTASEISVTDNGDNSLTIKNLTNHEIPAVRVFYKYYMEDEDVYVGGIAFTAKITRLSAGGSITIRPSHYTSESSRVVMTRIYDTNE